MKSFLKHSYISMLSCLLFTFLTTACFPKYIIQGQTVRGMVVNEDSGNPIAGAVVAVRWLSVSDQGESSRSTTLKAAQAVSDEQGFFNIPVFPDRDYVMGVYKEGYICWSSKEDFFEDPQQRGPHDAKWRKSPVIADGFRIRLKPFKKSYSREQHAGFVVLVAGECTDTHSGPFNEAIESENEIWRNTLRKNFRKSLMKY